MRSKQFSGRDLQEGDGIMPFVYDESPVKEKEYKEEEPICPECGSRKCDYFYYRNGEIIGCDDCIRREEVYG